MVGKPDYARLLQRLRKYRDDRDWAQFHNPKDLAIGISTEAGELLEHFLWRSEEEAWSHVDADRNEIIGEVADVAIYLVFLCDVLDADLLAVIEQKLGDNLARHRTELTRGRSRADG